MAFSQVNALAKEGTPFLFISDFEAKNVEVYPIGSLKEHDIEFCICEDFSYQKHAHGFDREPMAFLDYKKKFDHIIGEIEAGNTYLANLTQETKIATPLSLKAIYTMAHAHYKLRYKDDFVCFSPEKFVQIKNNTIHTFPMKGTIDASLPDAKEKILSDEKEMAEHIMIVDLLRNDLSMVAKEVRVEQFRYVQKICAGERELLQVSSHIQGRLPHNWQHNLGDILQKLLPAGSISGTPKKSTVEILKVTEGYERGFFSGVFGFFDGSVFDSGVMIRFVEKKADATLVYKSGGGITLESDAVREYEEMLAKIYLP